MVIPTLFAMHYKAVLIATIGLLGLPGIFSTVPTDSGLAATDNLLQSITQTDFQRISRPSSQMLAQGQMSTLGVVRGSVNSSQWENLTERLEATKITYQEVDLSRAEDLDRIAILFLPDVEKITAAQLAILQDWITAGGKVLVSGATGNQSSPGVRWALRSLLGAYWSTPLTQPTTLETIVVSSQAWTREGDTRSAIAGGVLMPTGINSQPIAIWRDARQSSSSTGGNDASAVIATPQTLYLGWRWGSEASSEAVDSSWLQVAIAHFQSNSSNDSPQASPRASVASSPNPATPTPRPSAVPSPARPLASSPTRPPTNPTTVPRSLPPTGDPDDQIAAAGVPVDRSDRPITTIEAASMRQELENLIGRFESALLSADSASVSVNLQATKSARSESQSSQILATAQQKLTTFKQMVRQQKYGAAREAWLQARQLLWENFPTDRPLAQTEIRAIWLDRGTIVKAASRQGLAQLFDRLAATGINTIFFETVNAGFPIYPSQVEPQQNPLTRGWDPLKDAVELAHERNMELHAWVWTFAAGNQVHNHLVNLPDSYMGPILTAHPDWANYDDRGNVIPLGQKKPFLDPANPAVRSYLWRLYEEIITRYDVDGLQLDYIRYPFQDAGAGNIYGYGAAARQQFKNQTGVDPKTISPQTSPQLWQQWTTFRVNQINSFVAETSQRLHKVRPEIVLSAAVFAMSEAERVQKLQQNWEVWARQGDIDMIVTMSYAQDTNRLQQLTMPWLTERTNLGSTLVIPGIRLLNLPTAAILDQIQAMRDLPAGGYALFAAENLDANATLQSIFNRTQRQNAPIPYRKPFAAAAQRFTTLQQEWSYLLTQDKLWIRGKELESWRSGSESLMQALTDLAEQPDRQKAEKAKAQLRSFREQFAGWMHLQSLEQGYQVRTWANRLEAMDKLLDYGERRMGM
jgi:uncharacterized lipoprotein YddW (UPF0748 family)